MKKNLYKRCSIAQAMVENRRAYAPRVVGNKKRQVKNKPWRAYLSD